MKRRHLRREARQRARRRERRWIHMLRGLLIGGVL
jgi:hypothetical protein